jgi:hypothetical protein
MKTRKKNREIISCNAVHVHKIVGGKNLWLSICQEIFINSHHYRIFISDLESPIKGTRNQQACDSRIMVRFCYWRIHGPFSRTRKTHGHIYKQGALIINRGSGNFLAVKRTMKRSSKMDPEIDHEDDYYLLEARKLKT